jgi:tetratricopeptide (TPR) repeat protein
LLMPMESATMTYIERGQTKMAEGLLEGVIGADAEKAESEAPNAPTGAEAFPLKAWADELIKQGKIQEALAKYDEALKYAPNWKQLKEVRETLAKQRS